MSPCDQFHVMGRPMQIDAKRRKMIIDPKKVLYRLSMHCFSSDQYEIVRSTSPVSSIQDYEMGSEKWKKETS